MARKTNKTSHVLNLITNGPSEAEGTQADLAEAGGSGVSAAQNGTAAAAAAEKVIVVNETSENEKLSNEIKNRLAEQLLAEEAKAAGIQAKAKGSESLADLPSEAADSEAAAAAVSGAKAPSDLKSEDSDPVSSEPEEEISVPAGLAAAQSFSNAGKPPIYHMVNVMEQILEREAIDNQMAQYGVCTCSRCRADVRALVLTRLPAKYVIVDQTATAPIIGYYEGKYRTRIFTEIMRACITVKENPRH